ncbi:MAG: hypothetical protein JNK67_02740 [Alphaproteobacteria bacterium]|nr:hypothetical protein [Alphaproteobacteria bacterium]
MISNVGTFAQNELLRNRLTETQSELNRLQVQVSSGKKSVEYSGLREGARLSLSLRSTRSTNDAFLQSNVVTKTRMEQMQTVLQRVKDISVEMRNAAWSAMSPANLSSTQGNAALKAQASAALQEMTQLLNTQIDGFHLFAGRETDAAPMIDPGNISTPGTPLGNVADIAAALPLDDTAASGDTLYDSIVSHLDGNVVGAVPGSSPVRYYNGEYSATAEALLTVRIDDGFDMAYGITGRDNSINNIMQSLYALSSVDLSATTDAGFRQIARRAAADLELGQDTVVEEMGELGVKQAQIRELTTRQQDFMTTIDVQLGDIEDVDMTEAISRLTYTQNALEASYRMIAAVRDLSLVRYL